MDSGAKDELTELPVKARVTRRLAAPPERAFDAWLDPDFVPKWFTPHLGTMVRVRVEARLGGSFSFVQRRNGQDFDHVGRYLQMDRPRRLAFTWNVVQDPPQPDARVTVEIEPSGDGCDVTVTQEMPVEWADFVSGAERAWGTMLDAMAAALG